MVVPQKIKNRISIWSTKSTFGDTLKRIESMVLKRYLYTHCPSSTIHNSPKVEATQCPLTDEWINKMWCIHTIEYFSAIKKKILTRAIACLNLKDIMLSKISQLQKDKYCVIDYTYKKYLGSQSHRNRKYNGDFSIGPVVKTLHFHCRGAGSMPGRGTKIPHALRCSQKVKKKKKKNTMVVSRS